MYRVSQESKTVVDSEEFKELEDCRAWAKQRFDKLDLEQDNGAFSCGTGCTWTENTVTGGKRVNKYVCTELITE